MLEFLRINTHNPNALLLFILFVNLGRVIA